MSSYFRLIEELFPFQKHTFQLELTDRCNLSCPACNQGMGNSDVHGKKGGFLHPGLFRKIMDDLKSSRMRFFEIQLFWFGEPLLHPDFEHIFSLLILLMENSSLFAQIDLHTNGLKLTERLTDLLLLADIKLPVLTFSIDAATAESYSEIRRGGDFRILIENIRRFLRKRNEFGQLLPAVRAQFLLQEKNRNELLSFISFWENEFSDYRHQNTVLNVSRNYINNETYLKKYPVPDLSSSLWPDEIFRVNLPILSQEQWKLDLLKISEIYKDTVWIKRPNFLPLSRQHEIDRLFDDTMNETGLFSRETDSFRLMMDRNNQFPVFSLNYFCDRKPCAAPFYKPVVRYDGELHICCNDPLGEMSLGNLGENSFDQLWFSEKALNIRRKLISGDYSELPVCARCRNMDGISITRDEASAFLEKYK